VVKANPAATSTEESENGGGGDSPSSAAKSVRFKLDKVQAPTRSEYFACLFSQAPFFLPAKRSPGVCDNGGVRGKTGLSPAGAPT